MSDIVEFLTARLKEDEHAALAEKRRREGGAIVYLQAPGASMEVGRGYPGGGGGSAGPIVGEPARALREVEAKRKLIKLADEATGLDMTVDNDRAVRPRNIDADPYLGDVVLRALAAVYGSHPDYREGWTQ